MNTLDDTQTTDGLGPLGVAATVAALTPEQLSQQVDLAQRLLGMAVNGTPTVSPVFPQGGIDLALHALLTAYMSLADAYELHTHQSALMAYRAATELARVHHSRTLCAPSQIQ